MIRKAPGLVCWYGGKGRLLSHILPMIPNTRVYVEPYGGAVMRHAPRVEVVWRNPACLRRDRLFSD